MINFYEFLKNFLSFFARHNVNVINVGIAFLVSSQMAGLVNSFVQNILLPVINYYIGKQLNQETIKIGKIEIKIGAFINSLITFFLTLYIVYLVFSVTDILPNAISTATAKAVETASVVSKKTGEILKNSKDYIPKSEIFKNTNFKPTLSPK